MIARLRASALLVAAALALGGCPPPSDVAETPTFVPAAGGGTPAPGTPEAPSSPGSPTPGSPSPGSPTGGGAETASAAPTGKAEPVLYERLRGGVWVARCPSCGEVQAPGATQCPGCRQPLSPWRKEVVCTRCAGEGRCDHCGGDRVCLACDGDGACASCGGRGYLAVGGGGAGSKGPTCPECGGNGRCATCRGDGRRDQVAGDFLPTEGWMPGACATCIDGSGLCPECGSTGKDSAGGTCLTCAGRGVCPDCRGDGACPWDAGDGACTVCAGGGREVMNGRPLAADERRRRIRTAAGSIVEGRVPGPPTAQGLRVVRVENGRAVETTLPRSQVDPVSWILAARDFAPGWDGTGVLDVSVASRWHEELAGAAAESRLWPLAISELKYAMAADPSAAQSARTALEEMETRRVDDWARRADEAAKSGDRDRAAQLLEMIVFKGRGTAIATRAELQLLQLRKNREMEIAKEDDGTRVRRETDAKASVERTIARARRRFDRSRSLLERALRAGPGDAGADRTFARAEHAAWSAGRLVEAAAWRDPAAKVQWSTAPDALVTESRLAAASVLESWAARAASGARFDLALRLAHRSGTLDPTNENAKRLAAEAEDGLARSGVLEGSPPPKRR